MKSSDWNILKIKRKQHRLFFRTLWLLGTVFEWFCGKELSLARKKYLLTQTQSLQTAFASVQPASVLCPISPQFHGREEVEEHFSWVFMDWRKGLSNSPHKKQPLVIQQLCTVNYQTHVEACAVLWVGFFKLFAQLVCLVILRGPAYKIFRFFFTVLLANQNIHDIY